MKINEEQKKIANQFKTPKGNTKMLFQMWLNRESRLFFALYFCILISFFFFSISTKPLLLFLKNPKKVFNVMGPRPISLIARNQRFYIVNEATTIESLTISFAVTVSHWNTAHNGFLHHVGKAILRIISWHQIQFEIKLETIRRSVSGYCNSAYSYTARLLGSALRLNFCWQL